MLYQALVQLIFFYVIINKLDISVIFGGINLRPVLFEIYGIRLYSYGLMIAIGVIVAVSLGERLIKKIGLNSDDMYSLSVYALIGGVLGGKLLYIIVEIRHFINNPYEFISTLGSGFAIYGSILGGIIAVYIFCTRKKLKLLKVLDLIIPCVAIAQGFGRIGCFLAGCCYGKVTDSIIGVCFNSPFTSDGLKRYPTQIFSSAFDFALGIFLFWYWSKVRKNEETSGKVFALYLIIQCVGRFAIEFIRDDPRGNIGPFTTSQFIGIFGFAFGVIFFILNNSRKKGSAD